MAEKVDRNGQHHAALLTCLHLSQVKKWEYIKLIHCSKLNVTFVHASKQHQGAVDCILPLAVDNAVNINMLTDGLSQLCQEHFNRYQTSILVSHPGNFSAITP